MTAGVETQLPGAVRLGAMFYYRTNRNQFGQRNTAVPTSAYTPFTVTVPNGPAARSPNPKPTTVDGLQPAPALSSARTTSATTSRYLDTDYKGVEFTATKRFSKQVADAAGLHHRQERGRRRTGGTDLNDPNVTLYPEGHHRQRLGGRVPALGQLPPAGDVSLAGSLIANNGYPFCRPSR